MNRKKILVTGSAGFIGFHLAKSLLEDEYEVLGIDNMNDYYNPKLKEARIKQLQDCSNFIFRKIDIRNKDEFHSVATDFNPKQVIHLAAQAGVRYSIENPYAYLDSNLFGFLNILEFCRHHDLDGLIYASSSSVYGANKKIPFNVEDQTDQPMALYGATKKANELMAYSYSHLYNIKTTGLRYFTVYGPWGRPDMAIYKFTEMIAQGKTIPVFNNGNMKRDFTFIDDIIVGTRLAMDKNYSCEIFNLGNHKSENLMDMINIIEDALGKEANKDYLPMQPGDVHESFADIDKTTEMLHYKPTTDIADGILVFIDWYKEFHGV